MPNTREVDLIEPVSGLPRSLLDIISCLEEPECEEKLWLWHGHEGDTLQINLWDAFRFAGMLNHRDLRNGPAGRLKRRSTQHLDLAISQYCIYTDVPNVPKASNRIGTEHSPSTWSPKIQLPTDVVLLNRLMACLHVIAELSNCDGSQSLVMNAALFPIFIAGCQVQLLKQHPEWDKQLFNIIDSMPDHESHQVLSLRDILLSLKAGSSLTPDELSAQKGLEIALL